MRAVVRHQRAVDPARRCDEAGGAEGAHLPLKLWRRDVAAVPLGGGIRAGAADGHHGGGRDRHADGGNRDEPADPRVVAVSGGVKFFAAVGVGWARGGLLPRAEDDVVMEVPIHGFSSQGWRRFVPALWLYGGLDLCDVLLRRGEVAPTPLDAVVLRPFTQCAAAPVTEA